MPRCLAIWPMGLRLTSELDRPGSELRRVGGGHMDSLIERLAPSQSGCPRKWGNHHYAADPSRGVGHSYREGSKAGVANRCHAQSRMNDRISSMAF